MAGPGSFGVISLGLQGVEELQALLKSAPHNASAALASALYQEASLIMGDSVELVPFRRGILAASADVALPQITPTSVTVTFGYGGAAASYAVEQHENPVYRHAPGRQAKFLEAPTLARAADIDQRLARRLRTLFSGPKPAPPTPGSAR